MYRYLTVYRNSTAERCFARARCAECRAFESWNREYVGCHVRNGAFVTSRSRRTTGPVAQNYERMLPLFCRWSPMCYTVRVLEACVGLQISRISCFSKKKTILDSTRVYLKAETYLSSRRSLRCEKSIHLLLQHLAVRTTHNNRYVTATNQSRAAAR
jgi:hypothetical protein